VVSAGSNARGKINGKEFVRTPIRFPTWSRASPSPCIEDDLGERFLSRSLHRAPMKAALESFLFSYNAMVKKLDAQVGEKAGLLSGESVVAQMSAHCGVDFGSWAGIGPESCRPGVRFDNKGVATLDGAVLDG